MYNRESKKERTDILIIVAFLARNISIEISYF